MTVNRLDSRNQRHAAPPSDVARFRSIFVIVSSICAFAVVSIPGRVRADSVLLHGEHRTAATPALGHARHERTLVGGPVLVSSGCPGDPSINTPVATPVGDQHDANAAPDGAGGAIVTWHDARSGTGEVYAQHLLRTGRVDPAWPVDGIILSAGTGGMYPSGPPLITTDGAGGAIVVWTPVLLGTGNIYAAHVSSTGIVDLA